MQITKKSLLPFLFGIIFGVCCALSLSYHKELRYYYYERMMPKTSTVTKKILNRQNYSTTHQAEYNKTPLITKRNDFLPPQSEQKNITDIRVDNSTAIDLYKNVRVLCWIMTSPATLHKKAISVKDTWSKRCNVRLFMSSVEDKVFPAVGLPVKEGRDQLYEKTKEAFKYVWKHYRDEADWFMKADDDTYTIVENLRFLLKDFDTNSPIFFGRRFKPFIKQGYMSGGAGYVLSKEALKRFIEGIDSKKCPKGSGVEDVEIGKCLSLVGVKAMDSRDESKKETFHPLSPDHHLKEGSVPNDNWLWKYVYYPSCMGPACVSNYPITFHYVSERQMYIYDYMIYSVRTYGVSYLYPKYDKSKPKRAD